MRESGAQTHAERDDTFELQSRAGSFIADCAAAGLEYRLSPVRTPDPAKAGTPTQRPHGVFDRVALNSTRPLRKERMDSSSPDTPDPRLQVLGKGASSVIVHRPLVSAFN